MSGQEKIKIIKNKDSSKEKFSNKVGSYGDNHATFSKEEIDALLGGKCVAIYDGEYTTFITFK